MRKVFADTYFWIAITDTNDAGHNNAAAFLKSPEFSSVVTTEEVLMEYMKYFAKRGAPARMLCASTVRGIFDDETIRVMPQSSDSFRSGLNLYARRPDKGYSLTDCISMAAMRAEGMDEILTNDAHFEQEGVRAVFRERR